MIAGKKIGFIKKFKNHNYSETKNFKDYDLCFKNTILALDYILENSNSY